jgi:hypothetical protein
MDCGCGEKTILFFYGELPDTYAAGLKAHLKTCPSCATDLAALEGLSAGFSAFKPAPPGLNAEELARAARGTTMAERFMAGFVRAAAAGAFAVLFLLAFRAAGGHGGTETWKTGIDSGLDGVEYRIYSLQEDLAGSSAAELDYGCADVEERISRGNA